MSLQPLTTAETNALEHADRVRGMMQGGRYIPSKYYDHASYAHVNRGPMFIWCCCGSGGGGGNGKGAELLAAIVLAIAAVIMLIQSALSAGDSSRYGDEASEAQTKAVGERDNSSEKRIYQYSQIIMNEASAERAKTALTQLMMAGGLGMLTVAFIIAYATDVYTPTIDTLLIYGGGLFGAGLVGYAVVQLHYKISREHKVRSAYDKMNALSEELKTKRDGNATFELLYLSISQNMLILVTVKARVPLTAAPPSQPIPISVAAGNNPPANVPPSNEGAPPPAYDSAEFNGVFADISEA